MIPRVIFHIDEMPKWKLLLHNVKNLIVSYGDADAFAIEVLANSEAVKGYASGDDPVLHDRMETLHEQGVVFAACNNALTSLNIPKEQLFLFVTVVPAGVRELTERQMDGYAYIKP